MSKQIAVDSELHARVKKACKALGLKLNGLTSRLLREWVNRIEREMKRKAG